MGLSALSSPTNGVAQLQPDRLSDLQLTTPEDSDSAGGGGGGVPEGWTPRPVDSEAMARITQYFTEASRATYGTVLYVVVQI